MRSIRIRLFCSAVALLLALAPALRTPVLAEAGSVEDALNAAWTFETPEPTPDPSVIPDSRIDDDGILRVYLRSLDSPKQLNLTTAGVYAVEGDPGFRFDRNTHARLTAAEGSVYLSVGGLNINMGRSVTLTRHAAQEGEENGLYIDESEKRALYCGDLQVSVNEDGGLRPVLYIHIEDYLCGVVAYEMSDSFPLEALKAQAVAARTYAMQRKWQAGSRDYDVVDTTADQVYKGYSDEYENVIQAVGATWGVVGTWNGGFAVCYYTASNGGQTALASQIWGSADNDGYLTMTDDPYDLENPRSLQNELTITPRCEGSAALKAMLVEALAGPMADMGYGDGEWAFYSIEAIAPVNPRFQGSRMYDGLRFTLRAQLLVPATPEPTLAAGPTAEPSPEVSGEDGAPSEPGEAEPGASAKTGDGEAELPLLTLKPAETPSPAPTEAPRVWVPSESTYDVTLDVYGQIKDGLSLGLNAADCELISVESETGDDGEPLSFTLVMRRFGHGVGMSQRGAQWMAGHYDMGWQEILDFYYPGMSVQRMDWPEEGLTDLEDLPDGVGASRPKPTPRPTPAPLPPLEEGEYYAVVTATTLNVRQSPGTTAKALAQLEKGRRVIVCGEIDAEGWVAVRTAEIAGYVKAEYLERE